MNNYNIKNAMREMENLKLQWSPPITFKDVEPTLDMFQLENINLKLLEENYNIYITKDMKLRKLRNFIIYVLSMFTFGGMAGPIIMVCLLISCIFNFSIIEECIDNGSLAFMIVYFVISIICLFIIHKVPFDDK